MAGQYTKAMIEIHNKLNYIMRILDEKYPTLGDMVYENKFQTKPVTRGPKTSELIEDYLKSYTTWHIKPSHQNIAKKIKRSVVSVRKEMSRNNDLQDLLNDVKYKIDMNRLQNKYFKNNNLKTPKDFKNK